MTSQRPEDEHAAVVDVLRVSTMQRDVDGRDPPVVRLHGLEQEMSAEGGTLLKWRHVDRYLMARLVEEPPPAYPQPPVPYLLGAFARCEQRLRGYVVGTPAHRDTLAALEQLCSHVWLAINPDTPIALAAGERGVFRSPAFLADAFMASSSALVAAAGPSAPLERTGPLPPSFLPVSLRLHPDETEDVLEEILGRLAAAAAYHSVLDLDSAEAIHVAWGAVLATRQLAAAVARRDRFLLPAARSGRELEERSAFARLCALSYIPDRVFGGAPCDFLVEKTWGPISMDQATGASLEATFQSARGAASSHIAALRALVSPKCLLSGDARDATVTWLAAALDLDTAERSKERMNEARASSHGFMLNLAALLLGLCEPFMTWTNGKAATLIDPSYVDGSGRLTYDSEPRFAAEGNEVASWAAASRERRSAAATASTSGGAATSGSAARAPGNFNFVTEVFFLAARAAGIGVVKAIEAMRDAQRDVSMNPPSSPQHRQAKAMFLSLRCALGDPGFTALLHKWCHLVTAWLAHVATAGAIAADPTTAVPVNPPLAFRMLPQSMLTDVVVVLKWLQEAAATGDAPQPPTLGTTALALTAFAGAPAGAIANPYTRWLPASVLVEWHPGSRTSRALARYTRRAGGSDNAESLYDSADLVATLVPALLRLFAGVGALDQVATGVHKLEIRLELGALLRWLWTHPDHRQRWQRLATCAASLAPASPYQAFLSALLSDCVAVLDEALRALPEFRSLLEDWDSAPPARRLEVEQGVRMTGVRLRSHFTAANTLAALLAETTAGGAAPPLLAPALVARVAETLNYFLRHLTGPDRAKLKVPDPEKYNFDPKRILSQMLTTALALHAADSRSEGVAEGDRRCGAFVAALAADKRSYRPENFTEAIKIAAGVGLPGIDGDAVAALEALAAEAEVAADKFDREAQIFADPPDELTDALLNELLDDPVMLPASGQHVSRAVILRHLLDDARDPFNRSPLDPEDLVEVPALRSRLEAWKAERRTERSGGAVSGNSA